MLRLLRPTEKLIQSISNANIQCTSKWMGTAAAATYEQTLWNIPSTKVTVLDNGLRVATDTSDSKTATVGLWIDVGSKFETRENNGVGHFFERLAFKGTKKRSQTDLELEVENLGAQLHSSTSREQTSFYAKCLSHDVPKAVEILSDVIQNSKLSEDDIEKERQAALNELEGLENNYQLVVMDYLHATAYQGTPLGRSIYGPTKNLKALKKKDLVDYIQTHFKAPRMVLAGAGGIEHEALVKLAEEHFKGLPVKYEGSVPREERCRFTGAEMRVRDDDIPLAHVIIAVEGVGWTNPDNLPLTVASTIIGSWDNTRGGGVHHSSHLAEVGAVKHFTERFHSFNISYKHTGLWGIYFVSDRMTIDDFVFNIQEEWMRLCTSANDFEVERAKNTLRTDLFLRLRGTTSKCEDIGRQMLVNGRRIPFHEMEENIEAITAEDVREACYKHIYNVCPAVVGVGPVEQIPDYSRIRANMYWVRY